MNESALLRQIGEALYGGRWQSALAQALGINDRSVRRWVSGEDRPRPTIWLELRELLRQRQQDVGEALAALNERLGDGG